MKNKYQPQNFEKKWGDQWEKEKVYMTKNSSNVSKKIYALSMFPYPSGAGLHVGHVRIYTGTDVLARFFRMNGYSVLHPMGWDAFGLPAENAAIKAKKNPMDIVPQNIATFKRQMMDLGFSYDWSREFSTTDPSYYRWTQWFFIQCFKKGLLYKKDMPVYYCEFCKTGLAEEEVLSDGTHERCGNPITRKTLPQWVFRITAYADRLLNDLQGLDWPKGILEMQKNWIGKSEGAEIEFRISHFVKTTRDKQNEKSRIDERIKVFTTRPDTVFGTTALILAPEHPVIKKILENTIKVDQKYHKDIQRYVEEASKKLDLQRTDLEKEKTGVFTGLFAENPVNGESIPIWIADYVLGYYGHGAVMFVPAHDERDYTFAKKYGIDIRHVISPKQDGKQTEMYYTGEGYILPSEQVKSFFDDPHFFDKPVSSSEFFIRMIQRLKEKSAGSSAVQYKLRDWIFSRQRYWGEPIPMIFCTECQGWFPVPEEDLPVELPYVDHYEPTGTGESPLARIESFVKTTCPQCGKEAKRETDTMPNWAGSCWYFLRFADPKNNKKPWDDDVLRQLLPVDWYLGGAEHAVLHLLYARFWVKVFQDLDLLDFPEPFLRLRNVGMVLAEDHKKMSKSLGNVINPDAVVKEFGADTLRMYEMFMAPFNQEIAWSTNALQGAYRFLQRVWNIYQVQNSMPTGRQAKLKVQNEKEIGQREKNLNKTIAKVTRDIQQIKYNTAIAAMMEFLNEWEKKSLKCKVQSSKLSRESAKKFLQVLAPFAPFITEEIWRTVFGEKTSIHTSSWPQIKEEDLKDDAVNIPVQINGKVRDVITISVSDISEETVVQKSLESEKVTKHINKKQYKIIYVKGKILNFVTL